MSDACTAVLDIGKTNKKLRIYDANLECLYETSLSIPEITVGSIISDDIEGIIAWAKAELKTAAAQFPIRALSIATFGATFVTVDENGDMAAPQLSYLNDPGESFDAAFYEEFGQPEDLQRRTGTPVFPLLLNLAKGIHYLKTTYPNRYDQIKHILFLPQYLSYVFCGQTAAEPTYTGCHNYLWDFEQQTWSSVAHDMNITHLLPETHKKPWDVQGTILPQVAKELGLSRDVKVTCGIHDSNAALLPYLVKMTDDFVLNSTGTWCVIMHQRERYGFSDEDMGKVVFYNLDVFNRPVKTAIFQGGAEYESYSRLLRSAAPGADLGRVSREDVAAVVRDRELFVLPSITTGSGQFPHSRARIREGERTYYYDDINDGKVIPDCFQTPERVAAAVNLSLAIQTVVALDCVEMSPGLNIFTEGGFRKNDIYNGILAALYPSSQVCLTGLAEASAFGAAMLGKCAIEGREPKDLAGLISIDKQPVPPLDLPGLEEYRRAFIEHINNGDAV